MTIRAVWLGLGVLLLAVGCGSEAQVEGSAMDGSAPVTPETALSAQDMREMLKKGQACSIAAFKRQDHAGKRYPRVLLGKVSANQAYADARTYAAKELAFFEEINPSSSEYARLENSINAISQAAAFVESGEDAQLKAMALHAYYESLITGQECPVDPRILQLVNK